jgi:hypothetical protein
VAILLKAIRFIFITIVSILIVWFGLKFGPGSDRAEAKVFDRIYQLTKSMPDYLFDEGNTSNPRKVIVNGNTTWLTVTKTADSIVDVLTFYEQQYPPQPLKKFSTEDIHKVTDKETKGELEAANKIFELIEKSQHFVLRRDNYGFWCGIDFYDSDSEIGSEGWFKKMKKLRDSGHLGGIGTGRIVIALRDESENQSTVLNIWTDRDFNINNLKPDESGDVPGFDIENVPRYPASKRGFSVEQDNKQALYRLVTYEGEGSVASNILFFHSRMGYEGWMTDSTFENISKQQNIENTMYYVMKGRECSIHVQRNTESGKIMTTVVESRQHSG